jgi:hypothetical protein
LREAVENGTSLISNVGDLVTNVADTAGQDSQVPRVNIDVVAVSSGLIQDIQVGWL